MANTGTHEPTVASISDLPQADEARTLFRRAVETSEAALESVRRNDVTAATASDVMRGARHALAALLVWHRVYDDEADFAEIIRRAENLAASIATPARVIGMIEPAAGKDTLSQPDHENVRSAVFTLRNLIDVVHTHLPTVISGSRRSSKVPA